MINKVMAISERVLKVELNTACCILDILMVFGFLEPGTGVRLCTTIPANPANAPPIRVDFACLGGRSGAAGQPEQFY